MGNFISRKSDVYEPPSVAQLRLALISKILNSPGEPLEKLVQIRGVVEGAPALDTDQAVACEVIDSSTDQADVMAEIIAREAEEEPAGSYTPYNEATGTPEKTAESV